MMNDLWDKASDGSAWALFLWLTLTIWIIVGAFILAFAPVVIAIIIANLIF